MKYCFTFTLLLIAASFVSPCGAAEALKIATFQADVTPPLGSPLCHGNVRPAEEIVDRLSARGIILLTEKKPIVLCSVDWVAISNTSHDEFREAIAEAVGTGTDRVSVHTVHQHDTPGIDFMTDEVLVEHGLGGRMFDPVPAWAAIRRTAEAAKEALEKTHPVTHLGRGLGKVDIGEAPPLQQGLGKVEVGIVVAHAEFDDRVHAREIEGRCRDHYHDNSDFLHSPRRYVMFRELLHFLIECPAYYSSMRPMALATSLTSDARVSRLKSKLIPAAEKSSGKGLEPPRLSADL